MQRSKLRLLGTAASVAAAAVWLGSAHADETSTPGSPYNASNAGAAGVGPGEQGPKAAESDKAIGTSTGKFSKSGDKTSAADKSKPAPGWVTKQNRASEALRKEQLEQMRGAKGNNNRSAEPRG